MYLFLVNYSSFSLTMAIFAIKESYTASYGVVQKLCRQDEGGRWSKNVLFCPRSGWKMSSQRWEGCQKIAKLCQHSYWMTPCSKHRQTQREFQCGKTWWYTPYSTYSGVQWKWHQPAFQRTKKNTGMYKCIIVTLLDP